MSYSQPPALTGELYQLPFQSGGIDDHVAPRYADLVAEYGVENVLVLKRFPTGIEPLTDTLTDAIDGVERPTVTGLSAHANSVLTELPDPPRLLDQSEQNLLVDTFIREYDWTDPYLDRASAHESFRFDVAGFVTETTWQGGDVKTDDESLAGLAAATEDFHDWLAEADALDPARSLRYAVDALVDPDRRALVQSAFDAVLALEFEEFTPIDREYLARLTTDVPLVCIAEAESAIQRTWNEPRPIEAHAPDLDQAGTLGPETNETPASSPAAVASYLATDADPTGSLPPEGSVQVIETETFHDEIAAVAEEIERLRRTEDLTYDEMAVVLRDSSAPIADALRDLRAAGVPVTSATVGGLEHDPAARELYALVSWLFRHDDPDSVEDDAVTELPGWPADRARGTLQARVGATIEDLDQVLTTVRDRGLDTGLADALNYWLVATDLKHRIAAAETPLEAKTQFQHVRRLRRLTRAVGDSALLSSDWRTLCRGFDQEMRRATSDKIATELELPDGGVLVDAVRVLKNERREAIFLLDVIDREYPADPQFTSLFPTPHLESLPGYPAFTTPTAEDVTATFTPATDPIRPLHAYYGALSRRLLAVGARCATDRLYFALHREDVTGTGNRQQPSRFLKALEDTFGEFERVEHDGVYSHGQAVRFALTRLDETLEAVRRAGLVTEPIDMADIETDFEAVQRILAADPPADLEPAIEARLDFAAGGVRRE